ncbi:hypoxanthine phosphoribosyltransferase [biofilm metagenome]
MLDEIIQVKADSELIYSEAEVERALDKLADDITENLHKTNPVLLCVLNGGIITAGRLLTRLHFPLMVDSINATRYQNQTSGGSIKWLLKPSEPLAERTVLIVDDVLDEGITLAAVKEYCFEQGAVAVHVAVLLDKNIGRAKPIQADFVGLTVPNRYLFGYGMDYKGYLRNTAGIYACREDN